MEGLQRLETSSEAAPRVLEKKCAWCGPVPRNATSTICATHFNIEAGKVQEETRARGNNVLSLIRRDSRVS